MARVSGEFPRHGQREAEQPVKMEMRFPVRYRLCCGALGGRAIECHATTSPRHDLVLGVPGKAVFVERAGPAKRCDEFPSSRGVEVADGARYLAHALLSRRGAHASASVSSRL